MGQQHFKKEIHKFVIGQNAAGLDLPISVVDYISPTPGPFVYLQASVHGAELQGNLVIAELMDFLAQHPFNGTFRFVTLANPEATAQKSGHYTAGRFNPQTGDNWNRNYIDLFSSKFFPLIEPRYRAFLDKKETGGICESFKFFLSSALQEIQSQYDDYGTPHNGMLNLKLQQLAAASDIVLDLHTGPIACRYIYAPQARKNEALKFCIPNIIEIPPLFAGAMDEASFMPWHQLEKDLNDKGITFKNPFQSYTLEFGSEERVSTGEAKKDMASLLLFLASQNSLTLDQTQKNHLQQQAWASEIQIASAPLDNFKTYYAKRAGLYEYLTTPGQRIKKGSLMAICHFFEQGIRVKQEIFALEDCSIINHNTSAAISKGAELFQVIENPQYY